MFDRIPSFGKFIQCVHSPIPYKAMPPPRLKRIEPRLLMGLGSTPAARSVGLRRLLRNLHLQGCTHSPLDVWWPSEDQEVRTAALSPQEIGVMGLLLGNRFLQNNWVLGMDRDLVGMQDIIAAIDYVCQFLGNANHIALGSDFDGGFGLDQIPLGLDSIADLRLIGDALLEYGYSSDDVEAILGLNWYHLLQRSLPEG